MKRVAVLLVMILAGLAAANRAPTVAHAATLTVCQTGTCTYSTIQAAINAAHPGDTILVRAGCYFENLDIEDIASPGITIMGAGPGPHTVDTNPADDFFTGATDPCFVAPYTTTTGTYIDGNCNYTDPTVYVYNAFVTIEGVTIQDGCLDTANEGAGVTVYEYSSVLLQNDWIFANYQENDEAAAGLYSYYGNSVTLQNVLVENNFEDDYGQGGIGNFSEGFISASTADAPPRSSRWQPVPLAAAHGARPTPKPHPATQLHAGGGRGSHARRASQPHLAATTAGSPQSSLGLLLNKSGSGTTGVSYNASYYGVGGVTNAGTAQINYYPITFNAGGSVGGAHSGDFNDNPIDFTTLNSSPVKSNIAGYYSYSSCDCTVGGYMVESILTTFNYSPITNNTYVNQGAGVIGVGGLALYGDGDDSWSRVHLNNSAVTNNTPPQCGNLYGTVATNGPQPC